MPEAPTCHLEGSVGLEEESQLVANHQSDPPFAEKLKPNTKTLEGGNLVHL